MNKLKRSMRDMAMLAVLVLAMALPGLAGLPVIDRDEARYAQATVQMLESGDYVNIRFQDRARNKKPAGAYWAQAASVKAVSKVENRAIWAHRLPSVLGALLAVLATYWGGARLLGRESAFYGAALLAVSFIFVFEAHIAKTDALLCGFSALCLGALAHLRGGGGRRSAVLFWVALGCAVMIKGPILPTLLLLCLLFLLIWERKAAWLKPLGFWLGPLLFLAIVLPWTYLIWRETGGAFFTEAIGNDLTPKLQGAQEKHPGSPGYYLGTLWVAFWPACLFLLPGLVFGIQAARAKTGGGFDTPVARSARLLLCWGIPFFVLMEFIPTKLPHYTLITFPAFALLAGAAVATIMRVNEFRVSRVISAVIYALVSIGLAAFLLFAQSYYGTFPTWEFAVMGIAILLCLFAAVSLIKGKAGRAFYAAVLGAALITIPTYQFTLPSLDKFQTSQRVYQALKEIGYTRGSQDIQILSPHFSEPSLVFHVGTDILLGEPQERLENFDLKSNDLLILDRAREESKEYALNFTTKLAEKGLCLLSMKTVEGFNYAKGDEAKLDILRVETCPPTTKIDNSPQ